MANAVNPYDVVKLSRTETLHMRCFGVCANLQISKSDTRSLIDELSLADGGRLNVMMRGRQPLCRGCQFRGH